MKKMILASSLLVGFGCGGSGGNNTAIVTDCSELTVLSDDEISINSGVLPAESCWLVESNFNLSRALVVKEGVVIEVAQDVRFLVAKEGSLTLEGTEGKPVVFTGTEKTKGFWQGIEVESKNSANTFDHAIVEYGGSKKFTGNDFTQGVIFVDDAQVNITNSILRNNAGSAFVFTGDSTVSLENSEISNNDVAGHLSVNLVGQISDSNTWDGNTEPSVGVGTGGAASNNPVETDQTWLDIGTSLKLTQGMKITGNLTLAPNSHLYMAQETSILVDDDGSFNLQGTVDEQIILEGANSTPGFWQGIRFTSKNSANVFDHVILKDAGNSGWTGADDSVGAIYLDKESKLILTNSEISTSAGFALVARDDGDITGFDNNIIKDNAQVLNLEVGQLGGLAGTSTYENNTESYISVPRGTVDFAALWKKQPIPFRVIEKVTVQDGVQVEPGVIVEFGENGYISVEDEGSLNAEGTADEKVVFTGADKIAGFWKGLEFESKSSENILKHVEVLFAGSEKWNGAPDTEGNIYLREGRVDISDSKISDGAGYAIVNSGDSELASCVNVDMSGNAKGEILDANDNLISACP